MIERNDDGSSGAWMEDSSEPGLFSVHDVFTAGKMLIVGGRPQALETRPFRPADFDRTWL